MAQVALSGGYAYVSERNGSLEAFPLASDGNLIGPASVVSGIPAGVIVGIAGRDDLIVAPVAHLASNPSQATIPIASATQLVQQVQTKEAAACWAAAAADRVCITNPGSKTVSCGHFGPGGFKSYTSAAATVVGESVFDIDIAGELVGILATRDGAPVFLSFTRSERDSDFLTPVSDFAVGSPKATGLLVLPLTPR